MKPCSWLLTNPALLVLQRVQLLSLNVKEHVRRRIDTVSTVTRLDRAGLFRVHAVSGCLFNSVQFDPLYVEAYKYWKQIVL